MNVNIAFRVEEVEKEIIRDLWINLEIEIKKRQNYYLNFRLK